MGDIRLPGLIVILGIALVVFGPNKAGLACGLGEAMRGFKQALRDGEHGDNASKPRSSPCGDTKVSRKDRDEAPAGQHTRTVV
jgi:TatA/E family protein of Tat protein translocase